MSDQEGACYTNNCSAERHNVLEDLLLRFTPLHELNDPFEGRLALGPPEQEKDRAKDDNYSAEWAQVELFIRSTMSTLGVLCLSRVPDNPVMWAHYASEQRGFVLGLRPDRHPFEGRTFILSDFGLEIDLTSLPGFGSFRAVDYRSEPIEIPFGGDVPWDAFFAKDPRWSYEQEVRLFRSVSDADKTLKSGGSRIYLFRIPSGSLARVILGANADTNVEHAANALFELSEAANIRLDRAILAHRDRRIAFEPIERNCKP